MKHHNDVVYVGFWARFFTFLIDSIAASLLVAPIIYLLVGEIDAEKFDLQDRAQMTQLLSQLSIQFSLETVLIGSLFIFFWKFRSATPGKMLIKSSVVDANTFTATTNKQNIIRYLGYYVSLIPLGLGFLWIAFDPRKQGWHDKLAGTVVIKGPPRTENQ